MYILWFLYSGKGAAQKKGEILRDLRRLLSKSDAPPIDAAIHAGAIPVLVQCLHFVTPDEQVEHFDNIWLQSL